MPAISQTNGDFSDFPATPDYGSAGSPSYQELCEMGRIAAQHIDSGRYLIGDLALEVQKVYRRDTINDFAKQIGVPKSRVAEYRTVCRFWDKSQREQIFNTYAGQVSYTHLRLAMRLKAAAAALDFVRECGDNSWTCEQASVMLTERLGKPAPAEKLLDGLGYVRDIRGQRVLVEVDSAILPALWEAKNKHQPVRLVVYRTEDTPDINPVVAILGSGYSRKIDTRLVTKVGA